MKRIFAFISIFCILISCKKSSNETEVEPIQKKIEVETLVPESIGSQKTRLLGRILTLSSEKITEHGFILTTARDFHNSDTTWLKITDPAVIGNNSILIENLPVSSNDNLHRAQYYVQTKNKKHWGNIIEFVPILFKVNALEDSKVTLGQNLTVTGDFTKLDDTYYIYMRSKNSIAANPVSYTVNTSKTSISFAVPENLQHGNEIDFILANDRFMSCFLAKVTVLGTLSPPDTYEYKYSDLIRFYGQGISSNTDAPFQIIIGNKMMPYRGEYYFSELLSGQKGKEFRIGYFNGTDTIIFPKKIKMNIPAESAFMFNQAFAHPGSTTLVNAKNIDQYLPIYDGRINFGGKMAFLQVTWNQDDKLTIGDVPEGTYPIEMLTDFYNYTSKQKLRVEKLKPTAISSGPVEAYGLVKVFGNFMDGQMYDVVEKDGSVYSNIAGNGSLDVYAISNTNEFEIVKIGYDSEWTPPTWINTSLKVAIKPAKFTGFAPSSGNYSTKITLYGESLKGANIHIGDIRLYTTTDESGNQSFYMPWYIQPGKYKISIYQHNEWLTSDQYFELKN